MARINREAFTLVEMLVVIVIISMLVALLVPAVISARESARRASCLNRMNQLGKGILQYEAGKGHLPGYVNQLGGGKLGAGSVASNNDLSWVVVIFDNIGRADLWKEWRSKNRVTVALSETVCPSDLTKRNVDGALSFAVNCGISDERGTDVPAYRAVVPDVYEKSGLGLFFDHDTTLPNGLPPGVSKPVTIALDGIHDGAQQTIMLSENLAATDWVGSSPVSQMDVGIVWWSSTPSWTGVPGQVTINTQEPPSNPRYKAHPSSNHPGGVNAVFADGHSEFISERVDYAVFRDQMISDQSEAKKYGLIP